MTDDGPDQNATETCAVTSADLDVTTERLEQLTIADWECTRPVSDGASDNRCVWHADPDEVSKPSEELAATVGDGDLYGAIVPGIDLTTDEIRFPLAVGFIDADLTDTNLTDTDLSRSSFEAADLNGADLTNADLTNTGFADASLAGACCSSTNFVGADLCNAGIVGADFSDANLMGADLNEATLSYTDLSGADLRGADLSGADLAEVTLTRTKLSRATDIAAPRESIGQGKNIVPQTSIEDVIARANHELRVAYSENGLLSRARTARVRERKARRREAFAEEGLRGTVAGVWSMLSQVVTGYGIRLRWILATMLTLYLGSAWIYWMVGGMQPQESLYYSIVTFTTSPPGDQPTGTVMRTVAGIETFAGTAAVVFLGYVLGTRETV